MSDAADNAARTGIIDSRSGFHAALRTALQAGVAQGCSEIWCADHDFAEWPLGERDVVDLFSQWVQRHRRLVLLAHHFDEFHRRHARWVQWRTHWDHVVTCKVVPVEDVETMPCVLVAGEAAAVRLHSVDDWRGRLYRDPADIDPERDLVRAIDERSTPGFAVTTLGL